MREDLKSEEYKVAREVIKIFLKNFPDVKKQLEDYIDKFLSNMNKPEMKLILEKFIKCDISILEKKDIPTIILSFFHNEQERINNTLYSIYVYLKNIYS